MAAILGVQRNLYFISFAANISFITIWMGKILSWHKHSLNIEVRKGSRGRFSYREINAKDKSGECLR